jgi:hypothetical protein
MAEHVYLISISIFTGTILLIFGMKYFAAIQQAKARLANDDAYRQLAAQTLASQTEIAGRLAGLEANLLDAKTRLASVEKMLKEVE